MFGEFGLTPAQYGVLASLADGDDLSQADLARSVLVRPQSMARLIADMIDQGWVYRLGPAGRGRRSGLAVTAKGERAFTEARPAVYQLVRSHVTGMDEDQTAVLLGLLDQLQAALAAADPSSAGDSP